MTSKLRIEQAFEFCYERGRKPRTRLAARRHEKVDIAVDARFTADGRSEHTNIFRTVARSDQQDFLPPRP